MDVEKKKTASHTELGSRGTRNAWFGSQRNATLAAGVTDGRNCRCSHEREAGIAGIGGQ